MAKKGVARNMSSIIESQQQPKKTATKGELTLYVQHSNLGVVVKSIRERLVESALCQDDPMGFLEAQAAAVEAALDAYKDPPSLPVDGAIGRPQRPLPPCPSSPRHKDIHCWCTAAGQRRRYICNDCGAEWMTK